MTGINHRSSGLRSQPCIVRAWVRCGQPLSRKELGGSVEMVSRRNPLEMVLQRWSERYQNRSMQSLAGLVLWLEIDSRGIGH